jgi:glucosamine 6-phosphate synthetase-like amidotransferase/phosphosugar isomerase protein
MGYIGETNDAWEMITQGINLLSNRGYDSAGLATIQNNELVFDKIANSAGQIDCIKKLITTTQGNHT